MRLQETSTPIGTLKNGSSPPPLPSDAALRTPPDPEAAPVVERSESLREIVSPTERDLAAELDKILMHKPVVHAAAQPAEERDAMGWLNKDAHLADSTEADREDGASFEWQQHDKDGAPVEEQPSDRPEASLQWIANARPERRRRIARYVMGWGALLFVGSLVMAGAAYALTGWTPSLSGILAYSSAFHS